MKSDVSAPNIARSDYGAPHLPLELWDVVLGHCDDASFAAMMNVCRCMRDAPSEHTLRRRIEQYNKKAFCPPLPRSVLVEHYKTLLHGEQQLTKLTRSGPRLLDESSHLRYAFFSPNSLFVVAEMTDPSSVRLFDLRRKKPSNFAIEAHADSTCVKAVAFSTDSNHLFIGATGGHPGTHVGSFYSLEGDEPVLCAIGALEQCTTRACFSTDGSMFALGDRLGGVSFWKASADTGTLAEVQHLGGSKGFVYALEFSPDGTRLVMGGAREDSKRSGVARIWDVTGDNPRLTHEIIQDRWVCSAHWSPDGTHVLLQDPDPREDAVWDVTGEGARRVGVEPHEAWVEKRRHNENDFYAGARDGAVHISDITPRPTIDHNHVNSDAHVVTTNVSPSGRFVVTNDSEEQRGTRLYDALAPSQQKATPAVARHPWARSIISTLIGT